MNALRHVDVRLAVPIFLLSAVAPAQEPPVGSVCPLIGGSNCQLPAPDFGSGSVSDLAIPAHGVLAADDFVPQASTVSQFCVWGFYSDVSVSELSGDPVDCESVAQDNFRVRVFTDQGGLPETLIGDVESRFMDVQRGPAGGTGFEIQFGGSTGVEAQVYAITLDEPITGLVPGERHWLEVVNLTARWTREGPICAWNWLQHFPTTGDGYSASGIGKRRSYGNPDESIYVPGSERPFDLAFCLGASDGPLDFTSGPPVSGACWSCGEPPTCTVTTALGCVSDAGVRGLWNRLDPDCSGSFDDVAGRTQGDECDESAGAPFLSEGLHALNTGCASGTGSIDTQDAGSLDVGRDLWFHYTTDCTGYLVVNTCPTQPGITQHGFDLGDPGLALYHDPWDPTMCVCPDSGMAPVEAASENCNRLPDNGPAYLESVVYPGECWTIRVADFDPAGSAPNSNPILLDLFCEGAPCFVASAVQAEQISVDSGGLQVSLKNRFLSIASLDVGREQSMRVKFIDLPPPYDVWNGGKLWVGEPTSLGGADAATRANGDAPYLATLECAGNPHLTRWNALGVVHVFHEGIVPGGVYGIQTVDVTANIALERCFADPLVLSTAAVGDVAGSCAVSPCAPADGSVDIADALAIISAFASVPGAISLPRADLEPACVDFQVNISDVIMSLRGFSGVPYPFAPSAADPCAATCAVPYALSPRPTPR